MIRLPETAHFFVALQKISLTVRESTARAIFFARFELHPFLKALFLKSKVPAVGRAFTLIETLAAIALITFAIIAPITLAAQSLRGAYFARDQITAFYMAQEAIEAIRSIRDANILSSINNPASPVDLLAGLPPIDGKPFTIDTRDNHIDTCLKTDSTGQQVCDPIETDSAQKFYGYGRGASGWVPTQFTRSISAKYVGTGQDEVRITVSVTWHSTFAQTLKFDLSENLYRWISVTPPAP